MKAVAVALCLCLLSFFSLPARAEVIAAYGDGYLEDRNGLPVLHIKGSQAEMGKQYGYLLSERIDALIAGMYDLARKESGLDSLPNWLLRGVQRTIGAAYWSRFPDEDKVFIRAMKSGAREKNPASRFNEYDLAFMNSIVDIAATLNRKSGFGVGLTTAIAKLAAVEGFDFNCDSFAAWGSRTVGGKTFQTRNTDIQVGMGLENYPLVIVFKPRGEIPYVSAGFVSMSGVVTGMNAYGVGIGQVWAFSSRKALGTPWALQMGYILRHAKTAPEAVEIFRGLGNRTYGSNFVFADANGNGRAVEVNSKDFVVFEANDPRERLAQWNGEAYGIPLADSVLRGDVALDPGVRSHQSASNGPKGDPRTANAYRERYQGQADWILRFEREGKLIGQAEAETVSRETAMRKSSLQAAVYANTDRELWVSYAKILSDGSFRQAYQGDYQQIPFDRFLPTLNIEIDAEGAIHGRVSVAAGGAITKYRAGVLLEARIEREGVEISRAPIRIESDESPLPESVAGVLKSGDVMTLVDPESGSVSDRLEVR